MLTMDRRCPPASYVGLIRARRTNRDPIARAARPLRIFACLALSRPNLPDSVLRGTTLGSHFTLFRLSLNNFVATSVGGPLPPPPLAGSDGCICDEGIIHHIAI